MMKKSLEDARLEFLEFRTSMIDCRAWMPGKYGGLKACLHCSEGRDAGVRSPLADLLCLHQVQAGPGP